MTSAISNWFKPSTTDSRSTAYAQRACVGVAGGVSIYSSLNNIQAANEARLDANATKMDVAKQAGVAALKIAAGVGAIFTALKK